TSLRGHVAPNGDSTRPLPPRRRRESGSRRSRGGAPEGPPPERAATFLSAKGAPPRPNTRGNAHPLSGRRQARADLSDDRSLAEPRQQTPTRPRAHQALTRPNGSHLRCLPFLFSGGATWRRAWRPATRTSPLHSHLAGAGRAAFTSSRGGPR